MAISTKTRIPDITSGNRLKVQHYQGFTLNLVPLIQSK